MRNEPPEIQELQERHVACVSYTGNYVGKPEVFARLFGVRRIVCSVRNRRVDRKVLDVVDRWTRWLVDAYVPNVYGAVRIGQVDREIATRPAFEIAVLQGNIDQLDKWRNPEVRRRTPGMYRNMAVTAGEGRDLALVILPALLSFGNR